MPGAEGVATGLLLASVLALWVRSGLALVLLGGAGLAAWLAGALAPPALLVLLGFGGLARLHVLCAARRAGWLVWAALLLLAAGLYLHLVPGFGSWPVLGPVSIGTGMAYEKWLSLDKVGAGVLLVALALPRQIGQGGWGRVARRAGSVWLLTPICVLGVAVGSGAIRWDPTIDALFLWWAILNLLTTCVAEEALFRGLLQDRLARQARSRGISPCWAVAGTALVFGLAHAPGGLGLSLLSTLAGLGYGLAFHLTGRLESAILCHFLVNSAHFLLFTYPLPAI